MELSGLVCRKISCLHPANPKSADICGVVNRQVPSSAIFDLGSSRNRRVSFKSGRLGLRMVAGFSDEEHLRYYYDVPRCGMKKDREKIRRNLKFLEGLSKDVSAISQDGFSLDPIVDLASRIPTKPVTEVDEILEKLSQMSAEVKELKRKKKQEKAKEKVSHLQTILDSDSSSSSSSSSDSECDEVINMSCLRTEARMQEFQPSEADKKITSVLIMPTNQHQNINQDCFFGTNEGDSNGSLSQDDGSLTSSGALTKRIEVCMGKSCSKSGAASLLEKFERVVGIKGAVSWCKCMGKCKNGPNVRVSDCTSGVPSLGSDSVRTPTNTSFIGVGLEDVGVIVADTFGKGIQSYVTYPR